MNTSTSITPKVWNIFYTKQAVWIFSILLFGTSCSNNQSCKDPLADKLPKVSLTHRNMEDELRACTSEKEVEALLNSNLPFAKYMVQSGYTDPNALIRNLYLLGSDPKLKPLVDSCKIAFGTDTSLITDLNNLFSHIKYYYPNYSVPQLQTIVTGFGGFDLALTDSLLLVGMEYFAHQKSGFKPADYPEYILKNFHVRNITPKVAMLASQKVNKDDPFDASLLSSMMYYGKAYYFVQQVMPCTPDSLIIEYSTKELKESDEKIHLIWDHFIKNSLFYTTKREVVIRYIDERPHTFELGEHAPGRLGRWLGWKIVQSYMETHPDVTLQQLMSTRDARKIFNESGFKPSK